MSSKLEVPTNPVQYSVLANLSEWLDDKNNQSTLPELHKEKSDQFLEVIQLLVKRELKRLHMETFIDEYLEQYIHLSVVSKTPYQDLYKHSTSQTTLHSNYVVLKTNLDPLHHKRIFQNHPGKLKHN